MSGRRKPEISLFEDSGLAKNMGAISQAIRDRLVFVVDSHDDPVPGAKIRPIEQEDEVEKEEINRRDVPKIGLIR